ncbi:MAG: enoyl-CoA hydratase/isomerase family protein [Alphaproteobacteria bacterium]|nr:enoyl-CoA hydratase/isomerase family protein [Alphaproteobacteria bacterium]
MSIDFELDDGIAVVTINRPERRNALDAEHYEALSKAWMRVRDDPDVRVAIITGAGDKAFCAGADLKSWVGREVELAELWLTQKGQLLNRGLEVWKPVIAAVNGACVGGGVTLLLATDIRVAVEGATFGLAEVKRGIIAANGGTQRIMEQLPHCIAMEMLLTGDTMDAATAERWGLINKVVPAKELRAAAMAYARKIGANAPLAIQAAKELALRGRDMDLATGLRMEQLVNRILQQSEDTREAKAAFADKRSPKFKGR